MTRTGKILLSALCGMSLLASPLAFADKIPDKKQKTNNAIEENQAPPAKDTKPGKHGAGRQGAANKPVPQREETEETYIPPVVEKPKILYSDGTISYGTYAYSFVTVSGGTFNMGGTAEQDEFAYANEFPIHAVTLTDFRMGSTEVPQWLWKAVMGDNPSQNRGDFFPVENVSYYDCVNFLERLGKATGVRFSLPTEAQWEFCARGGNKARTTMYAGSDQINDVAWYGNNSGQSTHEVGQKAPNELGIYDLTGNVWEMCADWYDDYAEGAVTDPQGPSFGEGVVQRGGSWYIDKMRCRNSYRYACDPEGRFEDIGFRIVTADN